MRIWEREAHELEEFRVVGRVRRIENSQDAHTNSVVGICVTDRVFIQYVLWYARSEHSHYFQIAFVPNNLHIKML